MNEPLFLTLDEVLQIHADMLASYGGQDGVRDLALLESAIAQPKAAFGGEYFHNDIPSMAAAYLFHIAKNHPFADGNKRTAVAAAIVFLKMNDMPFIAPQDDVSDLAERVASGGATKEGVIRFFRGHIEDAE